VVSNGFQPKIHFIWSDGCSFQFKSKVPWAFVSRYPLLCDGCTCQWNFFGSGHSKGPHDGAGAVLIRYIRQAQLDVHGPELQNAKQVVDSLHSKLLARSETSYAGATRSVNRSFWYVLESDVA
jgi:hypothetical protein